MRRVQTAFLFLVALAVLSFSATAIQAAIEQFELADHPDGNQNPPPYGLRLDDLLNLALASANDPTHPQYPTYMGLQRSDLSGSDNGVFSLSFGNLGTPINVTLVRDTVTGEIVISGTAIGGRDSGFPSNGNSDTYVTDDDTYGEWSIHMTYDGSSETSNGFEVKDIHDTGDPGFHGYIEMTKSLDTRLDGSPLLNLKIAIEAKADGSGTYFKLAYDDHRLKNHTHVGSSDLLKDDPEIAVARGWFKGGATDDFLLLARRTPNDSGEMIPEPVSLAVWSLLGLCAFGVCQRRCR